MYLLDILFGKKDTKERAEIENFIELASRTSAQELTIHINQHMETRMFLVGMNITAADIVTHLRVAQHFRAMKDSEKKDVPHAFRWVDHVQHLPGMLEIVQSLGAFVSFPSEKEEQLSKAQLKKLAKEQYKKDQKASGEKQEEGKAGEAKKAAEKKPAKEGAEETKEVGATAEKPKKQKQQ